MILFSDSVRTDLINPILALWKQMKDFFLKYMLWIENPA